MIMTPQATREAAALETTFGLARGRLTRLVVGFPPGAVALAHVQIRYHGWQLCPWNLGGSLAWDNYVYEMSLIYDLIEEPYEIIVRTWNEDDSYAHTIFVGAEVTEGEPGAGAVLQQYLLQGGYGRW